MTLTLGKKDCREGLNNLLHHVGVVDIRLQAAAVVEKAAAVETASHEGDDRTPLGPNRQRGEKRRILITF